jgi:hypothetical protein
MSKSLIDLLGLSIDIFKKGAIGRCLVCGAAGPFAEIFRPNPKGGWSCGKCP